MPDPTQIIRFRQYRRAAQQHSPRGRIGLGISLIVSVGFVISALAGLGFYASLTADLPSLESIPTFLEPPDGSWLQPTRLFDRTGMHVLLELRDPATEGWH